MFRTMISLLLPVALLVMPIPCSAETVRARPIAAAHRVAIDILPGTYLANGGGTCVVYRQGIGYQFVNDRGSRAWFTYSAPNQLRMVSGQWDPNIVVTVGQDSFGRTILRFDAPFTQTGYWVSN